MKTEKQLTDRLEKLVADLNDFLTGLPEEEQGPKASDDTKTKLSMFLGALIAYAYALDCEENMRQLLAMVNVHAATEKLRGVLCGE
jgi:hypothetical protein